jgi:hypothetical protein
MDNKLQQNGRLAGNNREAAGRTTWYTDSEQGGRGVVEKVDRKSLVG